MGLARTAVEKFPKITAVALRFASTVSLSNRKKLRGKNNCVINNGALMKNCRIKIVGNDNQVRIGRFCRLYDTKITIYGSGNVIDLDEYVYANKGDFYVEDTSGKICVGKHTTFAGATHVACIEGKTIKIGERCLFSSDIIVRCGDSHSLLNIEGIRINPSENVTIENHVWVGARAMVLKGVHLAQDSVVGTGAVVTKSCLNSNCVLAGNPAKVVKTDINWDNDRQ